MSYINQKYILTVKVKENSDWDSYDTEFVDTKILALAYELRILVGKKFNIKIERE